MLRKQQDVHSSTGKSQGLMVQTVDGESVVVAAAQILLQRLPQLTIHAKPCSTNIG
jgi:hypothetical protein